MTVFIAHAPKDASAAEALEVFLERRGQFVERDDGHTALRPITPQDVMVLMVSQDLVFAPMRLRLEQRALDAWADGRLVLVRLDKGLAPVGLRDLPSVDASFEAQREFKWQEVADAIRAKLNAARSGGGGPAPAPQTLGKKRRGGGGLLGVLLQVALAIPGLIAIAAAVSIWLVNRIGPTPGGWRELLAGVDAFGVRYGMPAGVSVWLFAAAIALTVLIIVGAIARAIFRPRARREALTQAESAPAAPEPAPPPTDETFVSYARANQAIVLPVIEGATQAGRKFWLDQKGLTVGGEGWAGEIVRAIRGAREVVVMCSKAAFESDHVKREVYLADRYHRRLIPVFVEDATPPEDFEYFFAGVQPVKLYETPEGERPQALVAVLGAAA